MKCVKPRACKVAIVPLGLLAVATGNARGRNAEAWSAVYLSAGSQVIIIIIIRNNL